LEGLRQLKSSEKLKSYVLANEIVLYGKPNADCHEESKILIDVS